MDIFRQNYFDKNPIIEFEQEDLEKPFKLKNSVIYTSSFYNGFRTKIRIEKGYRWNGANIPRFAWALIGYSPTHPQVAEASMVHDKLCENKKLISKNGRIVSSKIFRDILVLNGVPIGKANTMMFFVVNWQCFVGGWN